MFLLKYYMNLILTQINYGLIREESFTVNFANNEGKSVIIERFIKTLEVKIYRSIQ